MSDSSGPLTAAQIALVPGEQVTVMTLDLPNGLRGEAREKVARRQLRDLTSLGADAVEMRPFHGPRGGDSWNRVLVAASHEVAQWRKQAGAACRAVLPDYLALPTAPNIWTVAQSPTGVSVRLGPYDGFSAAHPVALALLNQALSSPEEKPDFILITEGALPDIAALAHDHDIPLTRDTSTVQARHFANGELGFDLRQDPQAARARLRARVLPWRWVALAASLAAGLWATAQFITTQRIDAERATLDAATMNMVRAYFIPTGPVLDIRTQVARALAEQQSATHARPGPSNPGPLDLLNLTASIVVDAPQVQVSAVAYDEAQGLTLRIAMDDFAALDRLVATLTASGLSATIAQSRATATATEAELLIKSEVQ